MTKIKGKGLEIYVDGILREYNPKFSETDDWTVEVKQAKPIMWDGNVVVRTTKYKVKCKSNSY